VDFRFVSDVERDAARGMPARCDITDNDTRRILNDRMRAVAACRGNTLVE
jgi:hypothetical protein